jgi:hypothetical protein
MENAATQAAALEGVVSALIVDTETGIIVHQEGVEDGLYPGLINAVYAELLRQPNTQVTPSPVSDLNDIVLHFDSHHHVIRPLRSASAPARHVFCVVANRAATEADALLRALVEIERQIDSAPPEVSRQSDSHYRKEQELSSPPPTDDALETTGDSHPLLPLLFGPDVLKLLDSGTP